MHVLTIENLKTVKTHLAIKHIVYIFYSVCLMFIYLERFSSISVFTAIQSFMMFAEDLLPITRHLCIVTKLTRVSFLTLSIGYTTPKKRICTHISSATVAEPRGM